MENYSTGDKIKHHLAPSFTMTILDTRDCSTRAGRPKPHLAYKVVDPGGIEDWLCAFDVFRV